MAQYSFHMALFFAQQLKERTGIRAERCSSGGATALFRRFSTIMIGITESLLNLSHQVERPIGCPEKIPTSQGLTENIRHAIPRDNGANRSIQVIGQRPSEGSRTNIRASYTRYGEVTQQVTRFCSKCLEGLELLDTDRIAGIRGFDNQNSALAIGLLLKQREFRGTERTYIVEHPVCNRIASLDSFEQSAKRRLWFVV